MDVSVAQVMAEMEREIAAFVAKGVIGEVARPKPEPIDVTINGRGYTMIPEGDIEFPGDGGMPTLSYRLVAKVPVFLNTLTVREEAGLLPPGLMDHRASWAGYADDGPPVGRGTEWKGYGE